MPKEQPPSPGELKARAELDQVRAELETVEVNFDWARKLIDRLEKGLATVYQIDTVQIAELREQLATSERMRAELSCELQLVRAQLMLCRELASGAIMEEYRALHELSELGYLSQAAYSRMDTLQRWLAVYGTP